MKRSLALLAVLAIAPTAAFAQGGVGIKAGLTFGNVDNRGVAPGSQAFEGTNGFTVGLSLGTASDSAAIGLRLEGLYARRGVNASNNPDSRRIDFADVPLMLEFRLPVQGLAPYLYGGPQISYQLRCATDAGTCPEDNDGLSYAAVVGAGLRLGGSSAITIEGRYMYGLTDFTWTTVSNSESYRTRQFLILAGIGF
jgi:hypothetical protein